MKISLKNTKYRASWKGMDHEWRNAFVSIADLLLALPQEHDMERLLRLVTDSIHDREEVALVRIWVKKPGDICERCYLREECPSQVECMHLVASSGQSIDEPDITWNRLDGSFSRFPIGVRKIGYVAEKGEAVTVNLKDDDSWLANADWVKKEGILAINSQPLIFRGEVLGVLAIFLRVEICPQVARLQRVIADHVAMSMANARAFKEIRKLQEQVELENRYLRTEIEETQSYGDIVGRSGAIQQIVSKIDIVAPIDANVLILGESGTGKELVAREIHRRSSRNEGPLIRVNCATIPANLFESELFGHIKGAFTGALRDRPGRFEAASGGTLFLDEIGEMPIDLQSKLLRVLQEGQYERVGDDDTRESDARIIAATNRDLRKEVEDGNFREDLYYRLNVFPMDVPPLRERKEDIPSLVNHFVSCVGRRLNIGERSVSDAQIRNLLEYSWPGNIRELQNVVERAMIVARGSHLRFDMPDGAPTNGAIAEKTYASDSDPILRESELKDIDRRNIVRALKECDGKIYGRDGAAELLDLKPTTLASRMKKYGIATRVKASFLME